MLRSCAGLVAAVLITLSLPAGAHAQVAPQTEASSAPSAPIAGQHSVAILGGTPITVVLVDKISSATANVGDTFAVTTSKEVLVDSWIVIPKGANGQGEVLSVDRAGSHGHPGSIGIQMDWVYAVDGEKVKLSSQRKTSEGESKAGVSSTMTIISWAFLGLPGLFAHNFVKGKDIELDGKHPVDVFVADTVHVVSSTASTVEAGYAH
jgi:hypothetical protein